MNIREFFSLPEFDKIISESKISVTQKKNSAYNIFSLSSYNVQRENYNSDIICSLLNPYGLHNEGNTFLFLFIDFLNNHFNINIDKTIFENAIVEREKGRIDICIKSIHCVKRQCIIIESKINNANDRDGQIDDYIDYVIKNGYEVAIVVYLTPDGLKFAPSLKRKSNIQVINVAAFSNQLNDLISGWLTPCFDKCKPNNIDSKSLIFQYIKLVKHNSSKKMEENVKDLYYSLINKEDGFKISTLVVELANKLGDYRADRFISQITDHSPFKNRHQLYKNYWLFENFEEDENNFKLDVWFMNNGKAYVVLWNTKKRNDDGYRSIEAKLNSIGMTNKFDSPSMYNGYCKLFDLSGDTKSIIEIDTAVLNLVKELLVKLLANRK